MLDKNTAGRPDADAVVETLRTAGFAAAAAPAHYVTSRSTSAGEAIEAIEVSEASPAMTRHAAADHLAQASQGSGIGTRPLLISLAVLLVILFGVVFLLPDTVTTNTSEQAVAGNGEAQDVDQQTGEQRPGAAENIVEPVGRDQRVIDRVATELVLGELLSKIATLEKRAVQRWGGLRFEQTQAVYAEADAAFLARDYATATAKYRESITLINPLLDEVNQVFATTFSAAKAALEAADTIEALRLFELAVAISPSHSAAQAGYTRARNLDAVLALTDQGFAFEKDLELALAQQSFEKAIALDPEWQLAQNGLQSVLGTMNQMEFDQRMTEGLSSLAENDFIGARAAFRMAQQLQSESREPADGLLQVDQGVRLNQIKQLERTAQTQEKAEQWEPVVATYGAILEIDADLLFAQQGRGRAQQMTALHEQLDAYLGNPDSLSAASTMNKATNLVVNITRMPQIGPHLAEQRDQLSRLLKRAATPLSVQLVSDNLTDVSIYKIAKLGSFQTHQLSLRPGTYVAVGSRPGYRDVRVEFRVAPEVDLVPIVIRCEETI